jgi:hypothetical protein
MVIYEIKMEQAYVAIVWYICNFLGKIGTWKITRPEIDFFTPCTDLVGSLILSANREKDYINFRVSNGDNYRLSMACRKYDSNGKAEYFTVVYKVPTGIYMTPMEFYNDMVNAIQIVSEVFDGIRDISEIPTPYQVTRDEW